MRCSARRVSAPKWEPPATVMGPWQWWIAGAAAVALLLDGLDGVAARRRGQDSAFGASFDLQFFNFVEIHGADFRPGDVGQQWVDTFQILLVRQNKAVRQQMQFEVGLGRRLQRAAIEHGGGGLRVTPSTKCSNSRYMTRRVELWTVVRWIVS